MSAQLPPGLYEVPADAVRYQFNADGSISIRVDPERAIPVSEDGAQIMKAIVVDAWEFNFLHRQTANALHFAQSNSKPNKDEVARFTALLDKLNKADGP